MIHPDPRRSRDWQMQCILEGAHGRENGRMRVLGLAVMCLVAFGIIPARALTGNDLLAGAAQRWITRWQGASDIWKALWIWTHIPALTVLVSFRLLSNVITSHPSFEAPSNPDIPLWRYIDLSKFVAFLQDRALYFARTDKLVDPFEGSLPKKNREILREQLTRDLGSSQAEIYLRSLAVTNRSFRTIMNISCWHANEHSQQLCGSCTANLTAQFAFRQHTQLSLRCFLNRYAQGRYIDYETEYFDGGNMFNPFMHKRISYEHERELRAIVVFATFPPGNAPSLPVNFVVSENGVKVLIDLGFIHKVFVSPTLSFQKTV